jgi:hypothetical protein
LSGGASGGSALSGGASGSSVTRDVVARWKSPHGRRLVATAAFSYATRRLLHPLETLGLVVTAWCVDQLASR